MALVHDDNTLTGFPLSVKTDNQPVSKPRVLFVIDTLQYGGAERSLLENVARFKNIIPIVCHLYKGDLLRGAFLEKGIKVHSLNIGRKYGFVAAYRALNKVVEQENPDLIIPYLTRSEVVSRIIARRKRIKTVGTFVVDLYSKVYNQHLSWRSKRIVELFKLVNHYTSRWCSGFIANSYPLKDSYSKYLQIIPERITVINRGRDSNIIRKKDFYANDKSQINFITVSRLFPVKNHKMLLEGFALFVSKYSTASLTIVGDGPLKDELINQARDLNISDKVDFLGSRNDVPELLCQYDCFVFPSLVEGFSGAVVEAMFAGLPVLASDIPPNQEAITHMSTGYLFSQNSVDSISEAMLWFSRNRHQATRFAKNAHAFALENFELNSIASQLESYLLLTLQAK